MWAQLISCFQLNMILQARLCMLAPSMVILCLLLTHCRQPAACPGGDSPGTACKLAYMAQRSTNSGPLTNYNYPYQKNPVGIWCNHSYTVGTSQYDPEATGCVRYHGIMKALLDSDYYAQYAAGRAEL